MRHDLATGIQIDAPGVEEFIDEIWAVCERHGFALSHEDKQGSFIVVAIKPEYKEWLQDAMVDRSS